LIIFAIHSFEVSKKSRKVLETHLDFKLQSYEDALNSQKKEISHLKHEIDGLKTRLSVASSFGIKK
jgi:CRISPR/Cas system type I-B associated protein Csh2 (Cas7 group RAMP superfamily)